MITTQRTHTPGPWEEDVDYYLGNGDRHHVRITAPVLDGADIAQVWGENVEATEANARLIAAAPELLAACERLKVWDESRGEEEGARLISEAASMARAAIAKATA